MGRNTPRLGKTLEKMLRATYFPILLGSYIRYNWGGQRGRSPGGAEGFFDKSGGDEGSRKKRVFRIGGSRAFSISPGEARSIPSLNPKVFDKLELPRMRSDLHPSYPFLLGPILNGISAV